jgi:uncharacterized lipoprotein YmbA
MRRNSNEIVYLETMQWAERLDIGLHRVFAANLGALLPSGRLGAPPDPRPDDISATMSVNVEQFDVDVNGKCVLLASWQVQSSTGETRIANGRFAKTRDGSSPNSDPEGAVNSMSQLAGDLFREVAQSIKLQ